MSLLEFFGLETTDTLGILDVIFNAIEAAIGLLILGILALIYLLGLIPNPFLGRFRRSCDSNVAHFSQTRNGEYWVLTLGSRTRLQLPLNTRCNRFAYRSTATRFGHGCD